LDEKVLFSTLVYPDEDIRMPELTFEELSHPKIDMPVEAEREMPYARFAEQTSPINSAWMTFERYIPAEVAS
jgi:hypothetical protein